MRVRLPWLGDEPPPRHRLLWHYQFGRTAWQRKALNNICPLPTSGFDLTNIPDSVATDADLSYFGNTMILKSNKYEVGHWRLNGGVMTLPTLFYTFGQHMGLMCWYPHADNMVKKRDHAWASMLVRDAKNMRMHEYGHYGHRE